MIPNEKWRWGDEIKKSVFESPPENEGLSFTSVLEMLRQENKEDEERLGEYIQKLKEEKII